MMTYIVSFRIGDASESKCKGQYTVSCFKAGEAYNYTVEDISEQFGVDPKQVIITKIERRD